MKKQLRDAEVGALLSDSRNSIGRSEPSSYGWEGWGRPGPAARREVSSAFKSAALPECSGFGVQRVGFGVWGLRFRV